MDFSESEIATLHAVAGFFGCPLVIDKECDQFTLAVCESFSLRVRWDYRTKKARFWPDLPKGVTRTGSIDSVNVSLNRPALAISKDIQRRLIPQAKEWAQRCRDYTAKLKREQQAEADFITRIFTANRSTPEQWGHRGSWRGKGLEIEVHHTGPNHSGDYVASVRVRSIQALEQIAAICATDHEFHHGKEQA